MRSTVAVAVAAALAAITLLLWSSSSGAPLVGPPQSTWAPSMGMPDFPAVTEGPSQQVLEGDGQQREGRAVDWLLIGFLVLVTVVILIVLRMLANRQVREREQLTVEEDEELVALLEATGDDVRYRALAEGDPRNAVVACWVALEEAVRRSGLHQNPAETAAELTRRVLTRWEVDETAIRSLSEAYREARFSRHPVSEDQRDRAVAALERIHDDLRRRVLAEQARAEEDEAQAAAAREGGSGHTGGSR
ncbi:hypothetical protein SGUI_1103 [Serinicoccus hydrothermalis]|uniref:Protein-glutamine gamma-glutamyltransferase-like C-terminal domain-containing protein n=2 Tax=Serinicoccus hydrothermalis TaxID=1758689 RepID=A0A1B1NAP2_9MICO|nr:hypothetical protein SGUI_1103 [Serinicoccus hydrothermalis]